MKDEKSPLESVDRALRLITLIQQEESITVSQAASYLGVAASTAHRLLNALLFRDYVQQDYGRRYRPGPALRNRSADTFTVHHIHQVSRPALETLSAQVDETVQLMVLQGGDIRFIDGIEPTHKLRVSTRTGETMPAFTSAGGKAMLAQFTNAELESLYAADFPTWPTGRISTVDELKKSMTVVRRSGFGTNFEETEQGVVGLGVSINDDAERPIAAITTATPSIRFDRADMSAHLDALRTAADAITRAL